MEAMAQLGLLPSLAKVSASNTSTQFCLLGMVPSTGLTVLSMLSEKETRILSSGSLNLALGDEMEQSVGSSLNDDATFAFGIDSVVKGALLAVT